jgi:hypothetical protein
LSNTSASAAPTRGEIRSRLQNMASGYTQKGGRHMRADRPASPGIAAGIRP